jgi:6-phosphofructokinase 1
MAKRKSVHSIALITSGGDAPGMNACIRAVVRTACALDMRAFGVYNGLQGLIDGTIEPMQASDVSGIIGRGGTILGTARCKEFYYKRGRKTAAEVIDAFGIDALIVCGGDGSFRGASALYKEFGVPFIGLPGTIDNDMYGTDYTIGFATAINTAVQAIDKIRDTARSHRRLFFVEVMGRHSGAIALEAAMASGADAVMIPETKSNIDQLVKDIKAAHARGRRSFIVIVAEGDEAGNAYEICEKVDKKLAGKGRVCVLGHIQRGGSPVAFDRVLATRMGYAAVKTLKRGRTNVFIGIVKGKIAYTPIETVIRNKCKTDISDEEVLKIIAT